MSKLSDLLDMLASYGGARLQSLEDSADEEFLGSFAEISASLIFFCRKMEQHAYIRIAEALESLDDPEGGSCCPTLDGVNEANIKDGGLAGASLGGGDGGGHRPSQRDQNDGGPGQV